MEELFESLFNATGRINRAKYWRSLIVFGVAGLFAAVVLFTAAGIAAPLFVAVLVVVLIPWLIWGFVIHTERLHDRDKSAWWLLIFYGLPALLGQWQEWLRLRALWVHRCPTSWCWQDLRSRSGGFSKSAACRGPADRIATAPTRFCGPNKPAG